MFSLRSCMIGNSRIRSKGGQLYYYEFDVSQLEISVLAALSRDDVLIDEIANQVDIHARNYSEFYNVPLDEVTLEQRKYAKSRTFELQYGASATGMSNGAGISKTDAKAFIDAYYKKYEGVRALHDELVYTAYFNAKMSTDFHYVENKRLPSTYFFSPMGRKFTYIPYVAENNYSRTAAVKPAHMTIDNTVILPINFTEKNLSSYPMEIPQGNYRYSRPQILNYICQGTGYDVVNIIRNKLMDLANLNRFTSINVCNRLEIHDSEAGTLESIHEEDEVYDRFEELLKLTLEETRRSLIEEYYWDIWERIPLRVEATVGSVSNLGELRYSVAPVNVRRYDICSPDAYL